MVAGAPVMPVKDGSPHAPEAIQTKRCTYRESSKSGKSVIGLFCLLGMAPELIIIIIIYLFSFNKVHVSCMDIYQQHLQCHSFCAILTMLHYLFQYLVERGIPVRQCSLSTMVVGYPPITIVLIMTNQ